MLMVLLTIRDRAVLWVLKVFACYFFQALPVPPQIAASRSFATLSVYILLMEIRISNVYVKRGKTA
jgi:hypothetical protein